MNILYVLNSGNFGGMEWHTYDLVKGMVERGHTVFVWCPKGEMVDWFEKAGASVFDNKIPMDLCPRYILKLVKFIKKYNIDVVHSHELKAVTNATIAAKLAKVPAIISHTHTPISEWQVPNYKKPLTRLTIWGYARLVNWFSNAEIALTESRKKVKNKEGIKENKLVVIPNSFKSYDFDVSYLDRVDYKEEIRKRYNIPETAFVFGMVGRLTEEKGHHVLLNAFKLFLENDMYHKKNFYLIIAGGGRLEEKLKEQAKKLKIENKVIFTGRFKQEDLVKLYFSFDVFTFSSLAEGFGLVLIEAMYSEIPVICSDLPVLKEVGADTVTYFRKGDSADLAHRMTQVYKSIVEEKEDSKVTLAKKRVEDLYTQEKFIDNYESLYTRLKNK